MSVLALDFGTANSYLSRCSIHSPNPQGIQLQAGSVGMATVLLERPGKSPLIGDLAANTFGNAPPSVRSGWSLHTQFKPDIAKSQAARDAATAFLKTLLENAAEAKVHLSPESSRVIFGVPSDAPMEFKATLRGIARAAGFGNVELLPEPIGALVFHVVSGQIPLHQARCGGLVVDFGGGTCDFAFLAKGEVLHSWGDFELGGRLFDDVFYQWFVDQNPGAMDRIRADGAQYYVHAFECRKMKEFFSETVAHDRTTAVHYAIPGYGSMAGMTWDEFVERAKRYRPSDALREERAAMNVPLGKLASDGALDLLEWFRSTLAAGLSGANIKQRDVEYVLLTGGSSSWPFVFELIEKELGLGLAKVIRSSNPYAAISEGLAALPALQEKFKDARNQLSEGRDDFITSEIAPMLKDGIDAVVEDISEHLTRIVFDEKIENVLQEFRSKGGTIADLELRIGAAVSEIDINQDHWIDKRLEAFVMALASKVLEAAYCWIESHGLKSGRDPFQLQRDPVRIGDIKIPGFLDIHSNVITAIMATVIASVTASVAGGGGMALIAHGPIGIVIGMLIGVTVTWAIVRYGKAAAVAKAESIQIPGWVASSVILRDGQIKSMRSKVKDNLREKVCESLQRVSNQIQEALKSIVDRELEGISVIQQIR